ncbi:peptidase [Achlya hypogyna]|uniref:Peptidase n=1 Tax=Achlya hypogyna TaxID=1202772 RepID=A0A1V9YNT6_ACHHY|nr:peptidase [Achlya hypogyna]
MRGGAILTAVAAAADACTTIALGKLATTTGAPIVTHAADCSSCDFRIGKVPPKTYAPGAMRNIAPFRLAYPRYVGDDRGSVFTLANVDNAVFNWSLTEPVGQIPQVPSTFGYISGIYGIVNERQVAIGESTCGGRLISKPITAGGRALFDVAELTTVAMERASTAREAIELMGSLAETYGYYGAAFDTDAALVEAGESLTVADATEAWVMHLHPDDSGASAVWAAQRIPDDHIAVVANQFILRELNLSDPTTFLASANVVDVAARQGWYDPELDGAFDWTLAYAYRRPDHYYATRRVWRVLTLARPSLELSPTTDPLATDYPVSVQVASPLSPMALIAIHRDHYEGTPFDLTVGPMAGPYGSPDRLDVNGNGNMSKEEARRGHQERALSMFRAAYSFVAVLDPADARQAHLWFGQYAPHATSYVPISALADAVPTAYSTGSLHAFDPRAAYWATALVGNWAGRFYVHSMPTVAATQRVLEAALLSALSDVRASVTAATNESEVRAFLTTASERFAMTTVSAYEALFHRLVAEFHDGYQMHGLHAATIAPESFFYPEWWLRQVGYFDVPEQVPADAGRIAWVLGCLLAVIVTFGLSWMGFTLGSNLLQRRSQGYSSIL